MEKKDSSKQILLSMVAVAILVVAVVGVSFAFFSYTLNGKELNELKVGSINFVANETSMKLNNAFPVAADDATKETLDAEYATDVLVSTVTISGKTTYRYGIDFTVTAEEIKNNLEVPVTLSITAKDVTENLKLANIAKSLITDDVTQTLITGHINPVAVDAYESTSLNSTITIRAFVDKDLVLISDTDTANSPREVYTTTQWNNKALSFRIKVVATQGTKASHEAANTSTGA